MSKTDANVLVPARDHIPTMARPARTIALYHGEKILAEIPDTLRRVGLLMLVLSISIPVFLVGLLIILWRLG
jgi:hypothetical protein